jgi:hypothetical protein
VLAAAAVDERWLVGADGLPGVDGLAEGLRRAAGEAAMGTIAVRVGRNGKKVWQAEQVYGGLFGPGPDPAELRAWVTDDTELGKWVADDFASTGRCPAGALDQQLFAVQLRKFPDPGDAAKRRAALGTACLCQDHSHFLPLGGPGHGGVHRGLPAGAPLSGLFWTAHITSDLPDPEAARIKMLKRPMYGRASPDLLRRRVLLAD